MIVTRNGSTENLSIGTQALRGASWFALFKFISQVFSWTITVIIAHILEPSDYGLLVIGMFITGYAAMFSELGLGPAVIQKPDVTQDEISSVFWLSVVIGILLAVSCLPIASLTARIFHESRVISVTRSAAFLFLFSALSIVPSALLRRELKFKLLGIIEMISTATSCIGMLAIATMGGGVWTLMGGLLIQGFTQMVLLYRLVNWLPRLHFRYSEVQSYLKVGVAVCGMRSLFYLWDQSDKFFAGRAWNTSMLGFYSFALQLAQLPTEKIVTLINQVSFPALSRLQNDKAGFTGFYLNTTKITATLVLPLFVGGYLVGGEVVKLLLNEKWFPMITVFEYLCLAQIMTSLNAINNFVHVARGKPYWSLYYHIGGVIVMPVSFFLAAPFGIHAMLIPWFTSFMGMSMTWIIITLYGIGISPALYLKGLLHPVIGTLCMATGVLLCSNIRPFVPVVGFSSLLIVVVKMSVGTLLYAGYLWFFDRDVFLGLRKLRKS